MLFAEPDENDRSYAKLCSSVFNGPLATNLEVIILEMGFLVTVAHNRFLTCTNSSNVLCFHQIISWNDINSIHCATAAEGHRKYCSWYGCKGAAGEQCEDSRQNCRNHRKSSTGQAVIAGQSSHAGKGYRKGKGQSPPSPQQAICQAPLYAWTSQCWLLWSTCWISQVRNTNFVEHLGVMLFFGHSSLRDVIRTFFSFGSVQNLHFFLSVEAIVYHGHDNGIGACRYELYLPMNEMWKEYARSLVTDCKY